MKIVFGIPFLYPAIAYGGAARAAYHLASSLHTLGHDVSVLTTDVLDADHRFNGTQDPAPFRVERLRNLSNSMAYWLQFYTPIGFHEKVTSIFRNADIVHLHTFRNLLNDRLARAAYDRNLPFVVTGHGTIPVIERFQNIKHIYDEFIGNWQLEHASRIIAVSETEKERLKEFGILDNRIQLIPNGCPHIAPAEEGKFREKMGLTRNEKIILFLGKITPRKGLQFLVRAFAPIKDEAVLVIAGNDMGYASKIKAIITELKIEDRIIWTGVLDDKEKAAALTDANVTVYASRDEAFGFVAIESILCGTPVIVCNDDGCGEIVRKTGGGDLVSWGDVAELSTAILRNLRSGKDPHQINTAQRMLQQEYNWENVAQETTRLYEQTLSKGMA